MNKPAKTQLQEIYQGKAPLPIYNTGLTGGGKYISCVTIADRSRPISGTPQPTKKDAERTAAEAALKLIFSTEQKESQPPRPRKISHAHQQKQPIQEQTTKTIAESIILVEFVPGASNHLLLELNKTEDVHIYMNPKNSQTYKLDEDCGTLHVTKYESEHDVVSSIIIDATRAVESREYSNIYIVSSSDIMIYVAKNLGIETFPSIAAIFENLNQEDI